MDNNQLFNILREIAVKCEELPDQAVAIEQNYMEKVKQHVTSHARLVDMRPTDARANIFTGFCALHYCAYFNLSRSFEALFDSEWDITTGQETTIKTTTQLFPLGQNSSALQIAILRRATPIIQFFDKKITGDPKFRNQFLPFQNRSGATHLHLAVLSCDCAAVMELFENKFIVESELPVGASSESIFGVISLFGQQKPLTMLMKHVDLHPLLYKCILSYYKKPSYLDLCERDVDYALFNTSKTQKSQLKKQIALLIQDALDYCVNQQNFEWKQLAAEWKKNPIYYYEDTDVMKQNGTKICVRESLASEVTECLEEYKPADWFSGNHVELYKIQYVGTFDEREDDASKGIYNGFSLGYYCILNNNIETLRFIIDDEKDLCLQHSVVLELKSGKIVLQKGSTLMHVAVSLNSVLFVTELLKQGKQWLEHAENGDTCYIQAIKMKNQASTQLLKSSQFYKQLGDEKICNQIVCQCFESQNTETLEEIIGKVNEADENTKVCIFKACFLTKNDSLTTADCKRIYSFMLRKAQKYLQENNLVTDFAWISTLKQYYGEDVYNELVKKQDQVVSKTMGKMVEETKITFSLGVEPHVNDEIFDQNAQKQQIYYENEVQAFDNQLFRDQSPFEVKFFNDELKGETLSEKITLMNLTLDDTKACIDSVQDIVKDDIVAKIPKRLQDWLESCSHNVLTMATSMHRSHLHAVDLRPSVLSSSPQECIYNGFCGIHYGIVNGHWDIVTLLLDYELCDVTKARVLIRAPGIGQNKLVVVPIGTNCLQLAALTNQTQILARLIDELVKRNTARLIDPIQMSFGKKPPLTLQDKLQLFVMKNELDENIMATLACCRAFWDEESVAALCLEFSTKEFNIEEKAKIPGLNQADAIVGHRMDLIFRYAALFTNARLIRLVRAEFLSNPLERFEDGRYAEMCFKVAQALVELHDAEYSGLYNPEEYRDTEREVDNTLIYIAAKYYLKQQENNQVWESLFQQLEQNEVFTKCKEAAIKNVDILRRPAYHSEIPGCFIRVQREIVTPHYYYLDNVVQKPELSCYFDAVIDGDIDFVKMCYKDFLGRIEKRQTRGPIINGFTALLYACYYKHIQIIKMLLQAEYDATLNAEPQQILVTKDQSDFSFIFKHRINFMQAAIMSQDQDLVDQLLKLVREQKLLKNVVFPEGQKTDIMKLAIYNGCGCIFKYGDLIKKELENESEILKKNNQLESILYSICKEQDPYSVIQVRTLLVQLKDRTIIEAFFYSSMQRLMHEDGITMTALDWLYSTAMTQLNKPKLIPAYQQAIKFVNQLTNSALIFAFNHIEETFARNMLEMYYGGPDEFEKRTAYFEQHKTEFDPAEYLFDKDESIKNNYLVKIHQIASQNFDQYSNEEEMCRWFTLCAYGSGEEVKKMVSKCAKKRDARMNNYHEQIYNNFSGLMYAIMMDNVQAFELLMNEEAGLVLENEQVLFFNNRYFYAMPGFSTLHLAALVGNQQFFDMLLRIYQSKSIFVKCDQSPSALALITNKQIDDKWLLQDFKTDRQLFRLAVQFGRVWCIKRIIGFGKETSLKKLFYENVFSKAETDGQIQTVLDLISGLEPDKDKQITDVQVQQVKNLVRQTIANSLTEIVVNNQLEEFRYILEEFYDEHNIVAKIRQQYEAYCNPAIINEPQVAGKAFCRVSADQLLSQQLNFTFYEHSAIEIRWFTACRINDVQFVKENLKSYAALTDKRQTSVENKINRGFTGLMYAIAYGSYEVAVMLLDIEYDSLTHQDTVVKIEQQLYYVPRSSSIIHLSLCTSNDQMIIKVLQKVRPASAIWQESNSLQFTPIVFMAGLGLCYEQLFAQFITRINRFEMFVVLNSSLQVNNYPLVKKFIGATNKNVQVMDFFMEFVFDVSQRAVENPNEAEKLVLKQQEIAIVYALEQKTEKFNTCLKNMFGQDIEKVRQEHDESKKYSAGNLVKVDANGIEQQFNIVKQDQLLPPPELECLPKSQLLEEQLKWFEACKLGDSAFVRAHLEKYINLTDDRASLVNEQYLGFNGLFYAVLNGQFEVFEILLPFEQKYLLSKPSVIRLPGADRYYLFEQGSSVVNLVCVCGQQKIYTWIIQQRDRPLYQQLFQQLNENKCIIQAQIGQIFFSKDVFVSFMERDCSENLIAQLYRLKDSSYIKSITTFVDVCGVKDKMVQRILKLTLEAIDFIKPGDSLAEDGFFKPLMDRALKYATSHYKEQKFMNLMRKNLKDAEIQSRIMAYVSELQRCDVVNDESYGQVIFNCCVVQSRDILITPQRDEAVQDEYLDEWFSACREGALDFIERSVQDCKGSIEKRPSNEEFHVHQGWSGLHYACYYNQLAVVQFLFQYEYAEKTLYDEVVQAPGIGYSVDFLLTRGSNCLMLATLTDNQEIVHYILGKTELDGLVMQQFFAANVRLHSSILIAALCWRSASGQEVIKSKLTLGDINQKTRKYESYNILQIIRYTNCAYLADVLQGWINSDNQLKNLIYQQVLETINYMTTEYGSESEREYTKIWWDLTLRDAVNHCLKNKETINWSTICDTYCKRCKILQQALILQFARTDSCNVEEGQVVIDDEFMELAQKKLKPVGQPGAQGTALLNLPGRKAEMRKTIQADWDKLAKVMENIAAGK